MSMLSGIAQFGLSAMQGYEQKKKELKTEAERLTDKQRQITREDASDLMAKESHNLQQQTGQYNLDQAKVKDERATNEYNFDSGLKNTMRQWAAGDKLGAVQGLVNLANDNPKNPNKFVPKVDANGVAVLGADGSISGDIWDANGVVLQKDFSMTPDQLYQTVAQMGKPIEYAVNRVDIANKQQDDDLKRKKDFEYKVLENGLGMSVADRERLALTAQYDKEKSIGTPNKALEVKQWMLEHGLLGNDGGGDSSKNPSTGQFWSVPAAGAGLPVTANNASKVAGQVAGAQKTIAQYKLPVDPTYAPLVTAMMGIESAGVVNARSPNGGGAGVMQLNPKYHAEANGTVEQNFAKGQSEIIRLNKKYNGNTDMVAAAYNAGESGLSNAMNKAKKAGRPDDWVSFLPKETQGHVAKFREAIALQGGGATQPAQTQSNDVQKMARQVPLEGKLNANVEKNIATLAPLIGLESKEPEARLALTQLSRDLSLLVNMPTSQRQAGYAQAITPILEQIKSAHPQLLKADKERLANEIAATVLGFNSIGEIGLQLGFAGYRSAPPADGLPKPKPNNPTPKQQAATTVEPNPVAKSAPMVQGKTGGVPNTAPAPLVSPTTAAAYPKQLPTAVGQVDNKALNDLGIQ